MRSFLGVPIVADRQVIGAFYLTEKREASAFTPGRPSPPAPSPENNRERGSLNLPPGTSPPLSQQFLGEGAGG